MKTLLRMARVCMWLMGVGAAVTAVRGQAPHGSGLGSRSAFEVVSVRPTPPDQPGTSWGGSLADRFEMKGVTVEQMVMFAYGFINEHQISGAEGWAKTARFDMKANLGEAEVARLSKLSRNDWDEQMRLSMQTVLAERFKLSVSFPKKELPVYVLAVARGGFKCTAAKPGPLALTLGEEPRYPSPVPPPPPPPPGAMPEAAASAPGQHWMVRGWSMWFLVQVLRNAQEVGGRVVIDRTDLHGFYDCDLAYMPPGADAPGPTFFTALQEQAGLKMTPSKELVETVQVLSVQRPGEN